MSADLEFVVERLEPLALLPEESRSFASCVPLDSWAFYQDADTEGIERSLRALLASAPGFIAIRFRTLEGKTPPYVRISSTVSQQDQRSWDGIYADWVRKLRALAADGSHLFAQPVLTPSDFARAKIAGPWIHRSDPKLPAILRCDEELFAGAEKEGTAHPIWRWIWEYGGVFWLMKPDGESAFRRAAGLPVLTQEDAASFWSSVEFVFRTAFELEGIKAACVQRRAASIAAVLGARVVPTQT